MASSEMLRRVVRYSFEACVAASVVLNSPILVLKEALRFSKTWVLTRATRRNSPEDCVIHSHRRENLKSYLSEFVRQALVQLALNSILSNKLTR
jgi:hypothetical protein